MGSGLTVAEPLGHQLGHLASCTKISTELDAVGSSGNVALRDWSRHKEPWAFGRGPSDTDSLGRDWRNSRVDEHCVYR